MPGSFNKSQLPYPLAGFMYSMIQIFIMKQLKNILIALPVVLVIASCGAGKNATDMKAKTGNLNGTWTVSNIAVDLPEGFNVTNVFDEGPYQDFQGSTWNLTKSGKGSYTLASGKRQDIFWTVFGKDPGAQFQFKKLDGEKAKNVDEGYRMDLENITANSFMTRSPIDVGDGKTGYITYTFSK